jgi:predicted RNase H-like HicB family nuclease
MNRYIVILKPTEYADEIGYTVEVPALPGCITEGDTVSEALANAREAIEAYIGSLQDRGLPVPSSDPLITSVEVDVAQPLSA